MPLSDKAEPLLQLFKTKVTKAFGDRIISLFKFGSLGDHGDFSLCSDVDVVLMLDKLENSDEIKVKTLWDEIKTSELQYADRLSVYWSSYREQDFSKGKGRFPALDRLDLIRHAILIAGEDCRTKLKAPKHEELVTESADFILSFMLAGDKADELAQHPEVIMQKGARYFTKFVLFPVRLIFTLDHPNVVGSNRDAVKYFNQNWYKHMPIPVKELINSAYALRNSEPNSPVKLNENVVNEGLLSLYAYCINRYSDAVSSLGKKDLANRLCSQMEEIISKKNCNESCIQSKL